LVEKVVLKLWNKKVASVSRSIFRKPFTFLKFSLILEERKKAYLHLVSSVTVDDLSRPETGRRETSQSVIGAKSDE